MQIDKPPLHALVIRRDYHLAWALPPLLARTGFQIDAISSSPMMKHSDPLVECKMAFDHFHQMDCPPAIS